MIFQIRLAGVCIRVQSLYTQVYELCLPYLDLQSKPEITVVIRPFDVQEEEKRSSKEAEEADYSPQYLETLAVYRKIAEALLEREIFLMHGAVLSVNGSGIMFAAPSGTGKTTHVNLWLSQFQDCHVINGDKPLIDITREPVAFGTPWCGKEHMGCNEAVPLKAICLLERGNTNCLEKLSPARVLQRLLRQVYMPSGSQRMEQTLRLFNRLCSCVPIYRLQCNMDPAAAAVAREVLFRDGIIE